MICQMLVKFEQFVGGKPNKLLSFPSFLNVQNQIGAERDLLLHTYVRSAILITYHFMQST